MTARREGLPLWLPVLALLLGALVFVTWNDARTERQLQAAGAVSADCRAPRDGEVVLIMVRVEAGQLVSRCTSAKGRT